MENLKIFLLIGLVVLLVYIVVIRWYYRSLSKKTKNTIIKRLEEAGQVTYQNNKIYFKINDETFEIIFYYLSKQKELSINSPTIWEEKHYKNRIVNQSVITKSPGRKIIIVYPSTNKITRYINENEIEFVDYKYTYNFYIITSNLIDEFINKIKGDKF